MLSTTARRRRGNADATRQHLLEVAALAFAEHGFAATSMSDLVARSGLTRGAFYFHFSSKEDLALATFRMKQREFIDRLAERLSASTPGGQAMDLLVTALHIRAELMQRDPAIGCLRRLCTELRADPRLAEQVAFHAEPVALLTSVLTQAQAEGDVRDDIPAERLALIVFAALVGVDELGSVSGSFDRATEDLIQLLARGLRTSS